MLINISKAGSLLLCASFLLSCAAPNPQLASKCETMLSAAEKELSEAKAKGLVSGVSLTKATALIGAARIQQQFDKYPNCINKAERAIEYIKISAQEK